MKKVFLTGSNGLLGQKIISLLASRDRVQLIALGKGPDRYPVPGGYHYESADLLDAQRVADLFSLYQPTHVIHSAAMTQVDACETERDLCMDVNVHATERIARLCSLYHAHLTYISTDFIFDGEKGPYTEKDAPNPVNFYGQSKLDAEQAILASGARSSILRTVLLYGVTPAMSRSNIVLWVRDSLLRGRPIQVVQDQFRSPTLAEDLASAAVSSLMREVEGIFHISGPEMMSILELSYAIADFWSLDKSLITPVNSEAISQPARRPPKTGFIILKAQTEMGYRPHTLRQGLEIVDKQLREMRPA